MDRAVEVTHTADGITLLFDTFSGESKNLLESFKNAGAAFHAAVIEDDGFLPDDVMSVYGFFLGDYREADSLPGKPLYFNQIQIPDYWRIEGDNSSAKVMDRTRERARIFFTEPTHRRQVKIVDWLDDAGQVRLSEHYNRYGAIFCHTVFNKKGQKALRKFFDVTGREMIVENFVTGDILVRWQDKDWIFRSKTDFIAFFIRCAGLEDTAVYFNSLSYPFFASQALAPNGFRDALFWHEPVGDEIPGNMQIILHDQGTRAKRVFVSRRESYDRLIALGAPSDKVKQLGYIYSLVRENKHRPHILVCTNSENVGHLTELASLMPQMHFHVAAITEMSSKLMSAGQYDNVSLYPNVKMSVLDSLFEKCDFYLDINHEGEIVDAVHRAFLNNMLIVGYEETMHNAYYTADTNTFKESEYADMAEALNLTLAMPHLIDEALAMQKKAAVADDATDDSTAADDATPEEADEQDTADEADAQAAEEGDNEVKVDGGYTISIPTINFQGANAAVAEQMAKDVEIDESDPAIQSLRKALEEVEIVGGEAGTESNESNISTADLYEADGQETTMYSVFRIHSFWISMMIRMVLVSLVRCLP